MSKFRLLALAVLILLLAFVGSVHAQDDIEEPTPTLEATAEATVEATVVVEQPPVIVVETPNEESGPTWFKPEHIIMLILGIGLAFSHPPQTGKLFGDIMTRAQEQAAKTPTMLDDVVVEAVNKAVKPRLDALDAALAAVTNPPPDGTAVG